MSFQFWVTETGEVRGAALAAIPSNTYDTWGLAAAETTRAEEAEALLLPISSIGTQYGITAATGPAPAVRLTGMAGSIGSSVTCATGSTTKIFDIPTTGSLGVGTWFVSANALAEYVTAAVSLEFNIVADTATATFSGMQASACVTDLNAKYSPVTISCIAVITVAGTLKLQVYNNSPTQIGTILSSTVNFQTFPNVTGYTAIRLA
jgi:hypothetical protein